MIYSRTHWTHLWLLWEAFKSPVDTREPILYLHVDFLPGTLQSVTQRLWVHRLLCLEPQSNTQLSTVVWTPGGSQRVSYVSLCGRTRIVLVSLRRLQSPFHLSKLLVP